MKLKLQITFIFLLTSLFCEAQYDIKWQKTIGGSDIDQLNSVTQSPNGGFVLEETSEIKYLAIKQKILMVLWIIG